MTEKRGLYKRPEATIIAIKTVKIAVKTGNEYPWTAADGALLPSEVRSPITKRGPMVVFLHCSSERTVALERKTISAQLYKAFPLFPRVTT